MEKDKSNWNWSRRDILKGIGSLPIFGAVWYAGSDYSKNSQSKKKLLENVLDIKAIAPPVSASMAGAPIRLGIIGFGGRGKDLCRAVGFATNNWKARMAKNHEENPNDTRLQDFLEQEPLNVKLTAVCDVFDAHAQEALDSFSDAENNIKRYDNSLALIKSGSVDAVIIATPDHLHAPISIAALEAGVHVYVEKPMTHHIAETYALREAAQKSDAVFAVGHQHRQTQSFLTAQDVINKKVLGHISLVQANTNRNDDNGAWQYDIHPLASENTIDWQQFLGSAPQVSFNAEHFFRWRKWWEYGSGLSGDLLTHDYDSLNCVLKMGIPTSVTASGGIYTHKDGRTVPDVMQVNMDFEDFNSGGGTNEKTGGMAIVYSATLGNQFNRSTTLMGHDGTMELGAGLTIYPDARSTKYAELLASGKIDPSIPLYGYNPALSEVDGITSATAKYFANKGLLWTYRDGKRVDATFLHLREWLSCIRNGGEPSCGIKEGFEEAITAHMAGLSYKLGRRIDWDGEQIVPIQGIDDLDSVLLDVRERVTV